jgi:glyoxylase-like metal-dependent hydrolase (beta-lactamase superfamily II)
MGKGAAIAEGVYLIGGPNISGFNDATSFIIDFSGELVMIDSGSGETVKILLQNMEDLGLDPAKLSTLILTHCHIDHIGGAPYFREHFCCRIIAHERDAEAIEEGDLVRTAAHWYGVTFPPTPVGRKIATEYEALKFGGEDLHLLHTPGHTPGSLCVILDRGGKRVLFAQDIHGPFNRSFGSNISQWKHSMAKLLALEADVLCEGHFGIFQPKEQVERYIKRYLKLYA